MRSVLCRKARGQQSTRNLRAPSALREHRRPQKIHAACGLFYAEKPGVSSPPGTCELPRHFENIEGRKKFTPHAVCFMQKSPGSAVHPELASSLGTSRTSKAAKNSRRMRSVLCRKARGQQSTRNLR